MTSTYGAISDIREILDIAKGEQEEKIERLKKLSNIWLDEFAPLDVMKDLSADVKNMAVNLHTVYLFSLSAGRFSDTVPPVAIELKDEGVRLLERAINNDAEPYDIIKINK